MFGFTRVIKFYFPKPQQTVKEDYYKLPYIIYRYKYLVPVPPAPVASAFLTWANNKQHALKELHKNEQMLLILKRLSNYYKNNRDTDPEILQVRQQQRRKFKERTVALAEYRQKYQLRRAVSVYQLFLQERSQDYSASSQKQFGEMIQKIKQLYKKLTLQQKKLYQQRAEEINKDLVVRKTEFARLYEIPKATGPVAYAVFMSKNKEKLKSLTKEGEKYSIGKSKELWTSLTEEEKQVYRDESAKMRKIQVQLRKKFLEERGLDEEKLKQIAYVCRLYQVYKKNKKGKKKEKERQSALNLSQEESSSGLEEDEMQTSQSESSSEQE